ncbi:hypothetical protein [Streptomyces paludis]|uniref:Uncharacterized protein n=1 Tax=Streptomyces paludis TaxID=2282738 RepID=A0A345HNH8_9ACTN|nr:hypothetical protein [Streptomyces paludis]AXG78252.1 hypothetical protein DVK44_11660 [Streptomyces paludis]
MPAPERETRPQPYLFRTLSPSSVPMKDLLASCAAARAVSTPPAPPAPVVAPVSDEVGEAAA